MTTQQKKAQPTVETMHFLLADYRKAYCDKIAGKETDKFLTTLADHNAIVRHINTHGELVEVCKLAQKQLEKLLDGVICDDDDERMVALKAIDEAIAKAEI